VGEDAGESFVLVVVEPGVNGVRIAVAEQASVGHGRGGVSVSDLEQGGATLADVGFGIVVAVGEQFGAVVIRERQGTALVHRETPLSLLYIIIRPYRTCASTFISGTIWKTCFVLTHEDDVASESVVHIVSAQIAWQLAEVFGLRFHGTGESPPEPGAGERRPRPFNVVGIEAYWRAHDFNRLYAF
jgi:hypothetical protein